MNLNGKGSSSFGLQGTVSISTGQSICCCVFFSLVSVKRVDDYTLV